MEKFLTKLLVLAFVSLSLVEAKARTIRNFRSLKGSNIDRIRPNRRLEGGSFEDNPLIYSVEKYDGDDGPGHGQNVFQLGSEIAKRNHDVKRLSDYVSEIQKKVDDLSESVVERVNEINNLVDTQLLGSDGI